MPQQMFWLFVSIAFSFIAWGIFTARYIWPELRLRSRIEALRPLLVEPTGMQLNNVRFGASSW